MTTTLKALSEASAGQSSAVNGTADFSAENLPQPERPSSESQAMDCYHCGLPVPSGSSWRVCIARTEQPMCCPGCEAVAQTIVDSGLTNYYQTRTAFAPSGEQQGLIPAELQLYDTPDSLQRFARGSAEGPADSEAIFSVEGIRCAACIWLIERRLGQVPGLHAINMNVATECLQVAWDSKACKPSDVLRALREIGYTAYPYDPLKHGEQLRKSSRTLFRQLFVAGLSMMQVMMYAFPAYISAEGAIEADMDALMRWSSLLLTLPAILYSARPFFAGAWHNLKNLTLGMDVPVVLGMSAAFIGSTVAVFRGHGEVYFDSVTMFIFLLLCSRYFEQVARRKAASALERLQHAAPASAARLGDYPASTISEIVAAATLVAGDFIQVKPGEVIAADGVLVAGESAIDMSLLTGESAPVRSKVGDILPGGAVNVRQTVIMQVTNTVQDSTLSSLIKLVERAGQGKPQIAQWADKVAAWFVAALLLFAVAVFAYWSWADAARAWPIAIAVLVVSCPCALSLATPSALAAATDRLVRQGVLVMQPHVLEALHRTTHVIFDKTGTLTMGRPVVEKVEDFHSTGQTRLLQMAAALESGSAHPLGLAIISAAKKAAGKGQGNLTSDEVSYTPGLGLEGVIEGVRYRLGSAAFVQEWTKAPVPAARDLDTVGLTPVYLGSAQGWLACFKLSDALREDAREVVEYFKAQGKEIVLLSGDQQAVTQQVARQLGIENVQGECLPEEKLAYVQALQQQGAVVAMIGDGINDAAVIRAADVSFAMGSGAALAQAHADTVLLSGRLGSVRDTAIAAAKTMRVIRQNLTWATIYNFTAIPAAALGLLSPWMSAIGMSLSSALVVGNALRLRRFSRSDPKKTL